MSSRPGDIPAEDELEFEPRQAAEVGVRLIVLAALCRRLAIEELDAEDLGESRDNERFDLVTWLRDEQLLDRATEWEQRMFTLPVGQLTEEDSSQLAWSGESLAALAWATGAVAEAPLIHEPYPVEAVLLAVPSPWTGTGNWLAEVPLRTPEELANERERVELWWWRASVSGDLASTRGKGRGELIDAIRETAHEGFAANLLPRPAQGDFSIDGLPFGQLSVDDQLMVGAIAEERLRALNWLCGFGETWDDAPVDISDLTTD